LCAGQHDTFLNVAGIDAVIDAVERCWASARGEDVLAYRRQHGLTQTETRLAILIQQLVMANVSAVIFSANPITGQQTEIVVTASWGLGTGLVSDTVTPDRWVISRDSLELTGQRVAVEQRMTVAGDGGTREVDMPRLLRGQPALSDEQLREVARLSIRLEEVMGWPVDIECAYARGRLYILQSRPITALS
jgi:pyruvate,water dikinase